MPPAKSRHAPPKAAAMIEALRGLGYSTPTALADVIDNSIAARANQIDVQFTWNGSASVITVLDDGHGMSDQELDRAMRLGERNPLEDRKPHDLGRFGMGLKTASFSQCRRLTVASLSAGVTSCLRWDLDLLGVGEDGGWHLFEGPSEGSEHLISPLVQQGHGTIVIWEKLDRIVTSGYGEQDFLDLVDRVERHLGMVFHRFLTGSKPRLRLNINGRKVQPWDPFLTSHPATWSSPIERLATEGGIVEVCCHVLPHKDRLDAKEHESAAGLDGWTAQQGFYVYRNERLLVAGSWLGLGQGRSWTKEEAHRLARIRLDITNSADTHWKIDIRKSMARPPVAIREKLTRLAENVRYRARRVFAHRGHPNREGAVPAITAGWRVEYFPGGLRYRIDRNHPAVHSVLEDSGELKPQLIAMLRVLEETIPVQRIWLDTTEAKETPRTGFSREADGDLKDILQILYRNLVVRNGLSPKLAREQLLSTEPFHFYPDLVAGLPDELHSLE